MKEIDWKKYYTSNELDSIIYSYIRETANELKLELSKKSIKLNSKKLEYV